MHGWSRWLVGGASAMFLVSLSVPAFAVDIHSEPSSSLVIDSIKEAPVNANHPKGLQTWTIKVSNLTMPNDTLAIVQFRRLTQGQVREWPKQDDIGNPFAPIPVQNSGTETFTFPAPYVSSQNYIDAAEMTGGIIKPEGLGPKDPGNNIIEVREESTPQALSGLPYGQLPEVPWAAALPMVGLGTAMVIWFRRRKSMPIR